jgi:hypothetical protein
MQSISAAYPQIGQEPVVQVSGGWLESAAKKVGEKWVNVYFVAYVFEQDLVSRRDIQDLLADFRSAGFTPFLGLITVGGKVSGVAERLAEGSYENSGIFHFEPSFKADAAIVAAISSRHIHVHFPPPMLSDPSRLGPQQRVAIQKSGLDCQIFVSTPRR